MNNVCHVVCVCTDNFLPDSEDHESRQEERLIPVWDDPRKVKDGRSDWRQWCLLVFKKKHRPPLNGCLSNEHVINASCRHATNIKGGTTCAIPQLRTKPMCCGTNFNNCHAAQTLWTVGCSIESDPKPKEHVADIQMQVKMWSWDWRRWTSQHHRL